MRVPHLGNTEIWNAGKSSQEREGRKGQNKGLEVGLKLPGMEEGVENGLEVLDLRTGEARGKRGWNMSSGEGDFLETLAKDDP